jgi:hypothetical protein
MGKLFVLTEGTRFIAATFAKLFPWHKCEKVSFNQENSFHSNAYTSQI